MSIYFNHRIPKGCPKRLETVGMFSSQKTIHGYKMTTEDVEVTWIRESETKVVLSHNGILVKELANYNDFYGYLSSMDKEEVLGYVDRAKERYGINNESTLSVDVYVSINENPYIAPKDADKENRMFAYIPREYSVKEIYDGENLYVALRPIPIIEDKLVYSSSQEKDCIEDFHNEFIQKKDTETS